MSLPIENRDFFYIFYREVKSEQDLETDVIDEDGQVANTRDLLSDVHENVEYTHALDNLDVNTYFTDWIDTVLSNAESIQEEIDPIMEQHLEYLAEDFAGSMKSRARERGKYVVFIVSQDNLVVCHSFTGKKALTTDMEVIEELLSEANIDKYARFKRNSSSEIEVQHFDRHDTESFSEWLGIPEDEIVFEVKGSVRVLTEIDGIDAIFEFDQNDITTKLLGSDEYDLSNGMLKTPNERARNVKTIRWGHKTFSDVEEFKQELIKTNYNLSRAFDLYNKEISNNLESFFTVIDYEGRIVKQTADQPRVISKPNVDFELSFVNSQVEMDEAWKTDLAQNLLSKHEPIPICHAGSEFTESPFHIGNFRVYNEVSLTTAQQQYIADLMKTAGDIGSTTLQPLFCHVIFELLARDSAKPLRYLFDEFSQEFKSIFINQISDGTRIIQTEEEEIDLEQKSPPWFERNSDVEELAGGINREFQSSRLLLLGITEDTKEIDVIEDGVRSELLNKVEDALEDDFGIEEAHVWAVPIDGGHGVVALNVKTPTGPFEGNIAVLEPS